MDSSKVRRSTTKISKNSKRFQVKTTLFLTIEQYYKVKERYQKISNFALELVHNYKREENEGIMFMESKIYEYPFGDKVLLISFVDIESYNRRLVIVNKHKQIVKLAEKVLSE